ncbi:hypothetical protein PI126_g24564 [Phytophthora idaei]|nr:hypothetical protein PI126_g24564 [Phytophthora idaei]
MYIVKVQKQFGKKVKFVRHDGAREFATNSLKDFYEDEGIEQQTTVPYAHQTNGRASHPNYRHDRPQHAAPRQAGQVFLG